MSDLGVSRGSPEELPPPARRRKFWNIMWSILEFPAWLRQDVHGWLLFGIIRSKDVMDIPGGLSVVMAAVLRQFVVGPASFPDAGVALNLLGRSHRVYARMGRFPSDGGALQYAFGWFGAGSIRCCFKNAATV